MKTAIVGFVIGASAALLLCSVIGASNDAGGGGLIEAPAAESGLDFAFPDARRTRAPWEQASGRAHHGWLFRTAYVEGRLGPEGGDTYSEQILKVGWPFTVVRGFVRTRGDEVELEGARVLGGSVPGGSARILPMQPVWPGLVLYGLLGAVAALVVRRLRADPRDTGAAA